MICASEVKNVLSATCNAFKKGRFWTDGGGGSKHIQLAVLIKVKGRKHSTWRGGGKEIYIYISRGQQEKVAMKWGENELKFQRRERHCTSSNPPPRPLRFLHLQFCISLYADPSNRRPIFPLKKQTDMKNYLILPLIHLPLRLSCLHTSSPVSPSIQSATQQHPHPPPPSVSSQ